MKILVAVFALFALSCTPALARQFTKCEFYKELMKVNVPKEHLTLLTCMAEFESSFRTDAKGQANEHGLYQISPQWWCGANKPCGNCNDLLSDDIRASVNCVFKVQKEQGWSAWSVYPRCQKLLSTYLKDC